MSIPLRLGPYEIEVGEDGRPVELGRGAMGITYRACDKSLDRPAALKVINGDNVPGDSGRARFQREARAAARINHPNVAGVYHFGEEAGIYYYAMEFVAGETLQAMMVREGPLPCGVALRLAGQVAAGLAAAHEVALIHRDLKPSNLMLLRHGAGQIVVKVIDFGLAKQTGPQPEADPGLATNGFVGTVHFASPEQIEGGQVDIRSDIYSLGATLWQMLTGRTLFTGTAAQVLYRQVHEQPPLGRLVAPPEVLALLESMLAKAPAERPPNPEALRAWIERALAAGPADFICRLSDVEIRGEVGEETKTASRAATAETETLTATPPTPQPPKPRAGVPAWALALAVLSLMLVGALVWRPWAAPRPDSSSKSSSPSPAKPEPTPREVKPMAIELKTDKTAYREGEEPKITVQAAEPGHLRLLYQDAGGEICILFPNQFVTDDRIAGGAPVQIVPVANPKAPENEVAIQISGPNFGTEYLVAIISDQPFADESAVREQLKNTQFVTAAERNLEQVVTKSAHVVSRPAREGDAGGGRVGMARVTLTTIGK